MCRSWKNQIVCVSTLLISTLTVTACASVTGTPAAELAARHHEENCTITSEDQAKARQLEWQEFDQVSAEPGSFRALADNGCPNAAAAAYLDWLENGIGFRDARSRAIGTFHLAQVMAITGHSEDALELMNGSFRTPGQSDPRAEVWNTYLHGVIGFFERNREKVEGAQTALMQMDDGFAKRQVGVLQGLLDCFEFDYKTAMSGPCRN